METSSVLKRFDLHYHSCMKVDILGSALSLNGTSCTIIPNHCDLAMQKKSQPVFYMVETTFLYNFYPDPNQPTLLC